MKDNLIKLLSAQKIDLEIDRLKKAKSDYPVQIERLKNEITELERAVEETEIRITENKKSRLMIEEEITAERDMLSKKEKRLLETQTNKEYTAVQHEIEGARERIDNLETEELNLMTQFDQLEPELAGYAEKYETVKEKNTAEIEEMQNKFDSIESDIDELDKQRTVLLSEVDARPLSVYNRLRKGKSGIAVSEVDQKKLSCSGCFKQLPPQKVLEVRRATKLIFCENCGRILTWDDRENSE